MGFPVISQPIDDKFEKITNLIKEAHTETNEDRINSLSENILKELDELVKLIETTNDKSQIKRLKDKIKVISGNKENIPVAIFNNIHKLNIQNIENKILNLFNKIDRAIEKKEISIKATQLDKIETTTQTRNIDVIAESTLKHKSFSEYFQNVAESPPLGDDILWDAVYITSKASNHTEAMHELEKKEYQQIRGNTMVTVSGFTGLNIAATRKGVDRIVMVDISSKNEQFWERATKMIRESKTAEEFLQKLNKDVEEQEKLGNFYDTIDFKSEIEKGISWLSTEEGFQKIKNIFDNGNFVFKRIDMSNPECITSLSTALKKANCTVDTLYASNVENFVEDKEKYREGLKLLVGDSTLVVDAFGGSEGAPMQRIYKNFKTETASIVPTKESMNR